MIVCQRENKIFHLIDYRSLIVMVMRIRFLSNIAATTVIVLLLGRYCLPFWLWRHLLWVVVFIVRKSVAAWTMIGMLRVKGLLPWMGLTHRALGLNHLSESTRIVSASKSHWWWLKSVGLGTFSIHGVMRMRPVGSGSSPLFLHQAGQSLVQLPWVLVRLVSSLDSLDVFLRSLVSV